METVDNDGSQSYTKITADMGCHKSMICQTIKKDIGYSSDCKSHRMLITNASNESREVKVAALLNELKHGSAVMLRTNSFIHGRDRYCFGNKWIITEDEPILSHDILVFLQNVDIEHPIGQLIRTCCEEYHSSFGCGTKTVLYLIGQWTNLCCNLKFQGIPISKLLFLLKESVRDCITFLDHLVIPTENFLDHSVVLSAKEKKLHFWDLTKMQNLSHNVLLVKTSVINNIHHVGYQKLAKVENTCTREEYILSRKMSARDKWISHVQWILKQLKVTILVATGKVDKNLVETLSCCGILVFENTEQTAVEALASLNEKSRIEPVVYITDATQKNVLAGILMEPLNADRILSSNQHSQELYIVLSTPQCQVQTLVLHHPAQAGLDLLAQEFQLSSHRVSSALNHGKVLPGGGTTEQKCADYLLNKAELLRKQIHPNSNGHELYMAEILLKLAESFQSFSKCVSLNSGRMDRDTSYNLILDDHFTKIQSWKTALQLVSILTRIDAKVVLGIPQ
ncbi:unnamed protein product [Acanthosepion pharaonis]|uniref:Uncharacterized protein n=1 Tax=Acanthosepion pharaonis TaxID=158019 RepID=A0A812CT54_ACAPH|nr:unnamed protein product [Sepia pharaonis]